MKKQQIILTLAILTFSMTSYSSKNLHSNNFIPFVPPISYAIADQRAETILKEMTLEEKIEMIGGHDLFFTKGFDKYGIPRFYFSDATQGVHIRPKLKMPIEKSTAFPCPIALAATWNPELATLVARSIGEECRASNVAVLLGPGMNIYRISQNGRNFEYLGEDPFLAARMVEHYVVGIQSTGTICTLKHFLGNNTDLHRRRSNSIIDERAIHEIYTPAFKAGIDAGAMSVMTSYNQLNGEWTGQSNYAVNQLLRKELGFKWLVMTDWWSVYDPQKTILSGMDLEMPGDGNSTLMSDLKEVGDVYVRTNAARLIKEEKVSEADINRMVKSQLRTFIAMGMYDRPVLDTTFKTKYADHEKVALKTARESIVLLRNENNLLPLSEKSAKKILVTGYYALDIARGWGSAQVEGFNNVSMIDAFKVEFGPNTEYIQTPTDEQIKAASTVIVSVGTRDGEGYDRDFNLSTAMDSLVKRVASLNKNVVVVVSSGGGVRMTNWNTKVTAIIYTWYGGQNGNTALAEILSGKTNPSGKLPISIEKKFEDSPGADYIPTGKKLYPWNVNGDFVAPRIPVFDINYKEGIFVGYRWYEAKIIKPLYPFGFGLSYSTFDFKNIKVSKLSICKTEGLTVEFTLKNTSESAGAEVAQLYIQAKNPAVKRPVKELKSFSKAYLKSGESKTVQFTLKSDDFAYWDVNAHAWKVDAGKYNLLVGTSSEDIKESVCITIR